MGEQEVGQAGQPEQTREHADGGPNDHNPHRLPQSYRNERHAMWRRDGDRVEAGWRRAHESSPTPGAGQQPWVMADPHPRAPHSSQLARTAQVARHASRKRRHSDHSSGRAYYRAGHRRPPHPDQSLGRSAPCSHSQAGIRAGSQSAGGEVNAMAAWSGVGAAAAGLRLWRGCDDLTPRLG